LPNNLYSEYILRDAPSAAAKDRQLSSRLFTGAFGPHSQFAGFVLFLPHWPDDEQVCIFSNICESNGESAFSSKITQVWRKKKKKKKKKKKNRAPLMMNVETQSI
jgi:hypothetical protein